MSPPADPSLGGLARGFRVLAGLAIVAALVAVGWRLVDRGTGGSGPPPAPLVTATFTDGLVGWSAAGVGEVLPQVLPGPGLDGEPAARFRLTDEEDRSELIFGGNGGSGGAGIREFLEGDEYWYGFAFYIGQMVWGHPGSQNLIMQLKSDGTGSPNLGLQLWDWSGEGGAPGGRGLWSEGVAMSVGGDEHRFLAPVSEREWHQVQVRFRASSAGEGGYEVFLDGTLVDSGSGVSTIVPGHRYAYIKNGIYRDGAVIPGTSELWLRGGKLGESRQSVEF